MRLLAIDFGTSNTVAALSVDGQAPRTLTFDASPLLPSAVFVAADGQVATGREALRQARLDPTRFEPNPKRRIDDGEVLLGERVVPVVDLIAAVLRTVAGEVRRQLGGVAPDEVRLTHPAKWGASRQNVLVTAARAAGLGTNLVLLPEPVAAAAQFTQLPGRALPPGGSVAIYDLGGGTFDVAVVGRTVAPAALGPGAADESQFHVLAEGGLPDLGGLDFDQAVLDHVGRAASVTDPGRWQSLQRPRDAAGRRAARALTEDVRAAKETLSRYPQTDVALPEPFRDAHLTRPEFDALIRPDLLRSVDVLASTLQAAGVAPSSLTGVFLVGGSSRIPLVAQVIQQRLGITATALDQPETAVVLGALLVPLGRGGNRTVAAAAPGAPGRPGVAGDPPGTGPRPVSNRADGDATVVTRPPGRRRTAMLVAGAVAVLLVSGGVVVALVNSDQGGTATVGTTVPGTSESPVSGTGADPSGNPTGDPTDSSGDPTTATSGLGPDGLLGAAEYEFIGPFVDKGASCSDSTESFNRAVEQAYRAERVVRCDVPEDDQGDLSYGRNLMYVITMADEQAADGFLDQMAADRQERDDSLSESDADEAFTAGGLSGRVVSGYELPALGAASATRPPSAIGWRYDGQPYVGLIVSLYATTNNDMLDFWKQNFRPRG